MRALVTGGTGLIGSHLVERLLREGVDVTAVVRPTSDATFLQQRGVSVVRCASDDGDGLTAAARGADLFFHIAGYFRASSPFTGREDYDTYRANNVIYTGLTLEAARAAGVGRYLYTSSVAVYANTAASPVAEDADRDPPSAYGRSKVEAEQLIGQAQAAGLATTVVRPAIVYGPRDRHFLQTAHSSARLPMLPLVAGGRYLIDVVYVGDVVEMLWLASQADAAVGRTYNAASGHPEPVRSLFQTFGIVAGGRPPWIVSVPEPIYRGVAPLVQWWINRFAPALASFMSADGITYMSHDVFYAMDRAREDLGFTPHYSFERGLTETFAQST